MCTSIYYTFLKSELLTGQLQKTQNAGEFLFGYFSFVTTGTIPVPTNINVQCWCTNKTHLHNIIICLEKLITVQSVVPVSSITGTRWREVQQSTPEY